MASYLTVALLSSFGNSTGTAQYGKGAREETVMVCSLVTRRHTVGGVLYTRVVELRDVYAGGQTLNETDNP